MITSFIDSSDPSSAFTVEEVRQKYESAILFCFNQLKLTYPGAETIDDDAIIILVRDASNTHPKPLCGYREDQPEKVHLFLHPRTQYPDPWLVLGHEMTHCFQRLTKRLSKGSQEGFECWDGEDIADVEPRNRLPWEKEANLLGLKLSQYLNGTANNPFQGIFEDD